MDGHTSSRGREVVVGTDRSATAVRAVTWAATEARLRRRPLLIVHAADYAVTKGDPGRRADAILAQAFTAARRHEPTVPIRTERVDAPPVRALVDTSMHAELLVIGMTGEREGEVLIGSVARRVSGGAHCPVTVVHRNHLGPSTAGPVLLGVGDPDVDAAAIDVAFADAQRYKTELVVLHARGGSLRDRVNRRDTPAAVERTWAEQLAPWHERYPQVHIDVRTVNGRPDQELVRAASTARLVVVGSRGRGAAARALLGSTSRTLIAHSPCPVTVVRDRRWRQSAASASGAPAVGGRGNGRAEACR